MSRIEPRLSDLIVASALIEPTGGVFRDAESANLQITLVML